MTLAYCQLWKIGVRPPWLILSRVAFAMRTLPAGVPSRGVGGQWHTRTIEAVLTLNSNAMPLSLTILQPPPGPLSPIPSL